MKPDRSTRLAAARLALPSVLGPGIANRLPLQVGNRVGSATGERHDVILPKNRGRHRLSGQQPATATAITIMKTFETANHHRRRGGAAIKLSVEPSFWRWLGRLIDGNKANLFGSRGVWGRNYSVVPAGHLLRRISDGQSVLSPLSVTSMGPPPPNTLRLLFLSPLQLLSAPRPSETIWRTCLAMWAVPSQVLRFPPCKLLPFCGRWSVRVRWDASFEIAAAPLR